MKKHILRRAGALVLALVLAMTLTVPAWAEDPPISVTDVKLNKNELTLTVGGSETLTATVSPDNATDKSVTWASSDSTVATVDGGTVTAVKAGSATITVTTADGGKTDTCTVTVTAPSTPKPITLKLPSGELLWSKGAAAPTITADLSGDGVTAESEVLWSIKSLDTVATPPTIPESTTGVGTHRITIPTDKAGEFVITAAYADDPTNVYDTMHVTISGIVIQPGTVKTEEIVDELTGDTTEKWYMYVNDSAAISVKYYGSAAGGTSNVDWMSSDSAIISVPSNGGGGNLSAWAVGKATITAIKNGYEAKHEIEVREDESVIADNYKTGGYPASVSNPLILSKVYPELKYISETNKKMGTLNYISNLSVPTRQGTLYYNYTSEGDTGRGIASSDRFAEKASGGILSLDRLYFVPKSGVTGTVDITFNAFSSNGNFSGIIRVTVGNGTGSGGSDGEDQYQISYRTRAGEPAWFLPSDFNAFCQSVTGRNYHTVTFSLPPASEGTLYYNYMAGTGTPVTTTTKFTPAGVYTLDNVCFVPNPAYADENTPIIIKFQVVDSSGETKSGTVEVNVIPVDVSSDPSSVSITGERGQPVALQGELFNDACQAAIQDTLAYVTFKLPDPSEGVMYYNYKSNGSYDSRVTASTRYYYSGVPSISGITFVPSPSAMGRIAIPYTGYGSTGTSFSGTLYIGLDEVDSSIIRYSVEKNGVVTFRPSDFYNAGLSMKGVGADYVVFDWSKTTGTDVGTLRYNYQSRTSPGSVIFSATSPGSSTGSYYVSPTNGQRGLSLLSFHAEGKTGTITIPYTAYCGTGTSQQRFEGQVVIQVGVIAAADVNVSCRTGGYVGLSSSSLSSACGPVMSQSLTYIEITGIPASEEGHLYFNYSGYGTGTAVKPGNRFYYSGSPSIDRLTFVPRAGFTGTAEITYTGYSYNSSTQSLEQASGRIFVNVSRSTTSQYFNDMSGHVWAIDSVDYLYRNRTVEGIGGGRFAPTMTMTKGDFTLMLVRAYGLTASGSVSFYDVPADSYYANAIRIAVLLGVASGSNGYFNPKSALSRQDAMLMIYNALKASGVSVTNGLAADFSAYHDEKQIAPYAREAIGSLIQMGVVEGDGSGYLRPERVLTRAEAAKLLHTIMTL